MLTDVSHIKSKKKEDSSLDVVDGDAYQFTQARGLIIIELTLGLVAVLPIGMAQVSSVNLTAEVGATLAKGEEFGYFTFGGSDIIVMFEADKVKIIARAGTHYNQGKAIATTINSTGISFLDADKYGLLKIQVLQK